MPDQNIDIEGVELEPDLTYLDYILFEFWIRKTMSYEGGQSSSTRYNGINIPRKKLLGNPKI